MREFLVGILGGIIGSIVVAPFVGYLREYGRERQEARRKALARRRQMKQPVGIKQRLDYRRFRKSNRRVWRDAIDALCDEILGCRVTIQRWNNNELQESKPAEVVGIANLPAGPPDRWDPARAVVEIEYADGRLTQSVGTLRGHDWEENWGDAPHFRHILDDEHPPLSQRRKQHSAIRRHLIELDRHQPAWSP